MSSAPEHTPRSLRPLAPALALAAALAGCRGDVAAELAPPEAPPAPVVEASKAPERRVFQPSRQDCERVPVYAEGGPAGSVCVEDAKKEGLTVVDLSDAWTPRVFAPGGKRAAGETQEAPEYRKTYLGLAAEPNGDLGLHGIAPNLTVLAARLGEAERACDAAVDLAPLVAAAASSGGDKGITKEALTAAQAELACSKLLSPRAATGQRSGAMGAALDAFRRRHLIVGAGLDADTVRALALGGEELAFRGLLRGLRERVADAAGLLEDGSASEQRARVVDRELDLTRFAPAAVEALPGGAADLVGAATGAAARELGWTSPGAARGFVAERGREGLRSLRVAVALPAAPAYHSAAMDLRVEIDRGGGGRARTFVVYARDGAREVPLVRWATTIGGWKKERAEDGEIAMKFKESDLGDRVWRQLIAAPAWMPPDSTPETDLLREGKDGVVTLKRDLLQPGYRNAYGLVMLLHEEAVARGSKTTWVDHGIRTHGSVDYRSIQKGTSHGCHRLYNQLALRLSGFLLEHRNSVRRGKMKAGYHRTLEWHDQTVEVDVPTRGFLYELDPPVPVRVKGGATERARAAG